MQVINRIAPTIWLRTERPVVPTNTVTWKNLPEIERALHEGVFATTDTKRPEFYEVEIGSNWYYIHIPSRFSGVYLIAVGQNSTEESEVAFSSALRHR
jgi:hypothetical protein